GSVAIGLPGIAPGPVNGEATLSGHILARNVHLIVGAWRVLDDDSGRGCLRRRSLQFLAGHLCQRRFRKGGAGPSAEHEPVEIPPFHSTPLSRRNRLIY